LYQKAGYPGTQVKYVLNIDENAGRGTATFEITESPKIKIVRVEFVGAQAIPQKKLRRVIKTRKHWMFSWITTSGVFKDDEFEDDHDRLSEFYREKGYIDFEIKDVRFEYPNPRTMVIRFIIDEGRQYKVGSVKFTGNKIFSAAEIAEGLRKLHQNSERKKNKLGPNGLEMDTGSIFTPAGYTQDIQAVADFYGSRGYIDVSPYSRNVNVVRVPNTETGTMDLEFQIDEGQKSYIEKIDIRGNTRTKDIVIRRELAVSPGEVFDMVAVNRSKNRLQGMGFFEKVDTRPEATDVPNRKDLVVGVEEADTGHLMVGAGFSSVDALVGYAEISQGNFDLFHPPTFTGGGQKIRLRVSMGTESQDYEISFVEPWFLGRKLQFSDDLYYREMDYISPNDLYNEVRAGTRIGLMRALGSEFFIGTIGYTLEDIGILLNQGTNAIPSVITDQQGYRLASRLDGSLAYDTRNSVQLPDKGQRSELIATLAGPFGGSQDYYKLELKTHWYFKGFFSGHVLELLGGTGVIDGYGSSAVPFYEKYYLGGLYNLRGFKYRNVSPREEGSGSDEPIGGDTYWFGSAEYSIPIIEQLRLAIFYDVGNVMSSPYSYDFSNFDDNWGVGIRLNLGRQLGPLRLDYGIPIHHDQYNSGSGQFQFNVSYDRPF
jgi:outer membrane protein insertion porin family